MVAKILDFSRNKNNNIVHSNIDDVSLISVLELLETEEMEGGYEMDYGTTVKISISSHNVTRAVKAEESNYSNASKLLQYLSDVSAEKTADFLGAYNGIKSCMGKADIFVLKKEPENFMVIMHHYLDSKVIIERIEFK